MVVRAKQVARASAAAAVAVSLTAATAVAVPPPPSGSFAGSTSQKKLSSHVVKIKTDASGHVSNFAIDWSAKCKKPKHFWTTTTIVRGGTDGVPMNGETFGETGSYTGKAGGGIKGLVSVTFHGRFTDADNASGNWKTKVKVMRKGKRIDTCKASIKWSASRTA
jgi:hypothetical protein